jgi:hypothetical protein
MWAEEVTVVVAWEEAVSAWGSLMSACITWPLSAILVNLQHVEASSK